MSPPEVVTTRRSITILMADDDEDDRLLTADALRRSRLINDLRFVVDGEDLMHYLRGQGRYADGGIPAPRPGLILLDLNMPRKGRPRSAQGNQVRPGIPPDSRSSC